MPELTFENLVAHEPRLADLLEEARSYHKKRPRGFCRYDTWYSWRQPERGLRRRMAQLVGWETGRDDVLGTSAAYELAYRTIYGALPACKHGGGCRPRSRRAAAPKDALSRGLSRALPPGAAFISYRASAIPVGANRGHIDPATPV